LRVDLVEDAIELEGEIGPVRTPIAPEWRGAALGMVETDDDLLLVIDVQTLVAGPVARAA
jgi:hypothetical protein